MRYSGSVIGKAGYWIGVELDELNGKNNGYSYFTCKEGYGLFTPTDKLVLLNPPSPVLTENLAGTTCGQTKADDNLAEIESSTTYSEDETVQLITCAESIIATNDGDIVTGAVAISDDVDAVVDRIEGSQIQVSQLKFISASYHAENMYFQRTQQSNIDDVNTVLTSEQLREKIVFLELTLEKERVEKKNGIEKLSMLQVQNLEFQQLLKEKDAFILKIQHDHTFETVQLKSTQVDTEAELKNTRTEAIRHLENIQMERTAEREDSSVLQRRLHESAVRQEEILEQQKSTFENYMKAVYDLLIIYYPSVLNIFPKKYEEVQNAEALLDALHSCLEYQRHAIFELDSSKCALETRDKQLLEHSCTLLGLVRAGEDGTTLFYVIHSSNRLSENDIYIYMYILLLLLLLLACF